MSDADSIDRGWGAAALDGTPLSASLWQVNTRGRKVIPMTEAELAASYKGGKLTGRSLVWIEGMGEWTPLGDVQQLAKLLRDSEPPPSGTRPRLDELTSGTEAYDQGAEITTNTGGLAVYERPLALIEFPEPVEAAEPADEPTPAYLTPTATPSAKARATAVSAALPKVAPRPAPSKATPPKAAAIPGAPALDADLTPEPSTVPAKALVETAEAVPPVPPLPSYPSVRATLPGPLFPAPVIASPLAAALSSTASAQARPATPVPTRPATPLPRAATPIPPPPALPLVATTAKVTAAPVSSAATEAISIVKPPRPAIEFLPPIMVHEKEDDDGASTILELPLHGGLDLREAPFSESTLVLSGRKRARRWISLNAAVALCVGAACLAASLTALVVRSRPAPPVRVVEKIVTVPAAPVAADPPVTASPPAVTTPEAEAAPAPAATEAHAKPAATTEAPRTAAGTERSATKPSSGKTDVGKSEPSESVAQSHGRDTARPDPSGLSDDPKPRREARAGFPTNPGF